MENNIILCHKCDGILEGNAPGLFGCGCMSGWVRDWQKPISFTDAVQQQIAGTEERIRLYRDQERGTAWMQLAIDRLPGLKLLLQ